MLIYSTPPVFSARFEVFGEDNYDGPYQVMSYGCRRVVTACVV